MFMCGLVHFIRLIEQLRRFLAGPKHVSRRSNETRHPHEVAQQLVVQCLVETAVPVTIWIRCGCQESVMGDVINPIQTRDAANRPHYE
jgi:hypothetical protein